MQFISSRFVTQSVTSGWQDKAPYEAKAAKRKVEYEKLMNAYNKKQEVNPRLLYAPALI